MDVYSLLTATTDVEAGTDTRRPSGRHVRRVTLRERFSRRNVGALGVSVGAAVAFVTLASPSATADSGTVAGTVSAGRSHLALRAEPTTASTAVEWLSSGTRLDIVCAEHARGQHRAERQRGDR